MKEITFTIPYPPSVNKIYAQSPKPKVSKAGKIYYPRLLSKEGQEFKKYVSELIFYTFPRIKYEDHPVEINIIVNEPNDNRTRDSHNGEKILYDAIQESGIINNDKQLVKRSSTPGKKIDKGSWIVVMRPYYPTDPS
jgi:Holliday junction resolvase RusA-like endonuclease